MRCLPSATFGATGSSRTLRVLTEFSEENSSPELDGGIWPRHGRVGAERPGFCGAKDQALAGPGTPVAKEWPGMGKKRKVFLCGVCGIMGACRIRFLVKELMKKV